METVDGTDVGEDSLNHVAGEGGARPSLLQESGTENLQEEKISASHPSEKKTVFMMWERN